MWAASCGPGLPLPQSLAQCPQPWQCPGRDSAPVAPSSRPGARGEPGRDLETQAMVTVCRLGVWEPAMPWCCHQAMGGRAARAGQGVWLGCQGCPGRGQRSQGGLRTKPRSRPRGPGRGAEDQATGRNRIRRGRRRARTAAAAAPGPGAHQRLRPAAGPGPRQRDTAGPWPGVTRRPTHLGSVLPALLKMLRGGPKWGAGPRRGAHTLSWPHRAHGCEVSGLPGCAHTQGLRHLCPTPGWCPPRACPWLRKGIEWTAAGMLRAPDSQQGPRPSARRWSRPGLQGRTGKGGTLGGTLGSRGGGGDL